MNVTSLIESGSDKESQVQVRLNPLNEFLDKAVENYSAMETNLFGNVLSTGKSDAEIFAAKSHNYGMEPTTADNVCYVSGQGSCTHGLGPATKFYLPSPQQCLSLSELPFLQVYVQANAINTASPNHQGAEVLPAKEGRSNANASQINANILQPMVKEPDISLCTKSEQLELDIINLTAAWGTGRKKTALVAQGSTGISINRDETLSHERICKSGPLPNNAATSETATLSK